MLFLNFRVSFKICFHWAICTRSQTNYAITIEGFDSLWSAQAPHQSVLSLHSRSCWYAETRQVKKMFLFWVKWIFSIFLFKKNSRSRDKRDFDIIKENHQFLWEDDDTIDTWGKQIAKKYHDKLFKEYCICDLRRYKENKVMKLNVEFKCILLFH
jgi:hypothetical protein